MITPEDKEELGKILFIPFSSSKGLTIHTFNYCSKEMRVKQYIARVSGYCPQWGLKKDFLKPYFEALNDEFLKVNYEIYDYGVYEFRNLIKNILGKTLSGHFLFSEKGVQFIESERIVVTRDYFGVHLDKEKNNE